MGPRQGEDHQQETDRGDHLGEEVRRRGAVGRRDRDGGEAEHGVGDDSTGDAARHLGRDVGQEVPPPQPTERRVDQGDNRVEVSARDWPEHEDEGEKAGGGRGGVLEKLNPCVAG